MGYLVFALGTPLIMTEPWDVDPYLNTWSSPVIWLMLGGFFMAFGGLIATTDRRYRRPIKKMNKHQFAAVKAASEA